MKRVLYLALLILFSYSLSAQTDPVKPLNKKAEVVQLQKDFNAFSKKISTTKVTKYNRAQLANEYSDLIDRIDQQFHTPKSKIKADIPITSTVKKKERIDH